jgi:hypothetical protein
MFLFSFCYIIHSFLWGKGQSVQEAMLVYPRGSCGNTSCCLFAHLLVCVSKVGLEPVFDNVGDILSSQCNMAWKSFVLSGGLECWGFASSSWFFSCQVCLQRLSKIFDLQISCSLLPPSSHHLGSPSFFHLASISFVV